jgi:SpoVK/Ycf46/Vps4 family AAA+-type ATPase
MYGESSSSRSSSSSSSGSSEGFDRKERSRARKERSAIQPLHLQIQHQMRRMEAEAGTAAAAGGGAQPAKKSRDGALADIDPIEVDSSVDWTAVGGLDSHVNALKEMVVLPLLYPELFERFHVQPPKGVLFFGPPGQCIHVRWAHSLAIEACHV